MTTHKIAVVVLECLCLLSWESESVAQSPTPILHEYFDPANVRFPTPSALEAPAAGADDLVPEPVYAATGPRDPSGVRRDRPGGRNAPEQGTGDLSLDRDTDREGWLTYYAVFDPSVVPFKRVGARDRVVVERGEVRLTIGQPSWAPVELTGGEGGAERETFRGSVLIDLEPGVLVPIPSVAPDMLIHQRSTIPPVDIGFYRDGADNYLVRGDYAGLVRLDYLVSAPSSYFGGPLPGGTSLEDIPRRLRPAVPEQVLPPAREVYELLGLTAEHSVAELVWNLAGYFRSFRAEPFPLEEATDDIYRDILLGGRGVCRHRTFAFVVTLQAWGIPARYVYNEAHTFAEVYLPEAGWRRIDLGGGAEGLEVMNASSRVLHAPTDPDPLPQPPGYEDGYSNRVGETIDRASARADGDGSGRGGDGSSRTDATHPLEMSEMEVRADPGAAEDTTPQARRLDSRPQPSLVLVEHPREVFRGEAIAVRGRLTDGQGRGLVGRSVAVILGPTDPTTQGASVELGHLISDQDGVVAAEVAVPHILPLGEWGVYLVFTGDAGFAPARSP